MAGSSTRRRRALALVLCLGLAGALAACDSGGSGRAAGTTSTTRRRKPHASTTTSSTSTTTTTLGGAQPDTAATDPNAPTTTTSPSGAAPCGAQAPHLIAAVTGGDLGSVPVDSYTVDHCRLASSNLIWGAVTLTPKPGQTVAPMTVVLERIGSIWEVHSFASGPTGCDAPAPVRAELGLGC